MKEKRFVLASVKSRLRSRFNVAVSEVGHHEKWQRTVLAVVTVSVDGEAAEATCQKVLKFIERDFRVEILDWTQEIR